jgi:hypothetical protein
VKRNWFLINYLGFHTIENLYPYANSTDLIADNYDANTYLTLNSCIIKISVKEAAKSALETIKDYCDLNVKYYVYKLDERIIEIYHLPIG